MSAVTLSAEAAGRRLGSVDTAGATEQDLRGGNGCSMHFWQHVISTSSSSLFCMLAVKEQQQEVSLNHNSISCA